jgi:hypothetical protein
MRDWSNAILLVLVWIAAIPFGAILLALVLLLRVVDLIVDITPGHKYRGRTEIKVIDPIMKWFDARLPEPWGVVTAFGGLIGIIIGLLAVVAGLFWLIFISSVNWLWCALITIMTSSLLTKWLYWNRETFSRL